MNEIGGIAVDMAQFVAQNKYQIIERAVIAYSVPFLAGWIGVIYYAFFRLPGGMLAAYKRGDAPTSLIAMLGAACFVLIVGATGLIKVVFFSELYIAEHITGMVFR